MNKRIKKPHITPEQRREWLKRHDQGEKPPKIADTDDVDVRTVRLHLNKALEEREIKEARSTVLRNALEGHYGDLRHFAERLDSQIAGQPPVSPSTRDDYLQASLRQHLPRSPIWRYLARWDILHQKISQIKPEIERKLEKEVKSDTRLDPVVSAGETMVIPGIVTALVSQTEQWVQGFSGLNCDDNLISEPAEEGFVNLRYGAWQMGKVKQEHVAITREVLEDFKPRIIQWGEYDDLEKSQAELKRVRKNLRDELAVIILRRIVPGKCKYCPL
jgi:hypothetical protein